MATVFNKYLWQQTDREKKHYNQQRANVSVHFHEAVNALFSFRIDGFPLHFSCSSILYLFIFFLALSNTSFFILTDSVCVCVLSQFHQSLEVWSCVYLCADSDVVFIRRRCICLKRCNFTLGQIEKKTALLSSELRRLTGPSEKICAKRTGLSAIKSLFSNRCIYFHRKHLAALSYLEWKVFHISQIILVSSSRLGLHLNSEADL